jgi:hypothetical protein
MRKWARYFLLILCTLALVGGSTASFAASFAAEPCAHEHGNKHAGDTVPHKHHGAGCLSCCPGACVAIPDLPPRDAADLVTFSTMSIAYWETDLSLPSRSIAPDLGPPRSKS